jgi:hypothetical protein
MLKAPCFITKTGQKDVAQDLSSRLEISGFVRIAAQPFGPLPTNDYSVLHVITNLCKMVLNCPYCALNNASRKKQGLMIGSLSRFSLYKTT